MFNFSTNKKPHDFLQEIAQRHKILRKQAGFSQRELAQRSGVSLGSLKRFERTGLIAFESLLLLADVLNRLHDFEAILQANENLDAIEKMFSDKTRS